MKFLRSLGKFWLVIHIGSWMLLTFFLALRDTRDLPSRYMISDSAKIEIQEEVLLLIPIGGLLISAALYALRSQGIVRAIILFIASFTYVTFIMAIEGSSDSPLITNIESIHLNEQEYHLISYPRSFFTQQWGNYFPEETAFVLYACGYIDWGQCEAVYWEAREGWLVNPSRADIVAVDGAIQLYIDDELVYTLYEGNPIP